MEVNNSLPGFFPVCYVGALILVSRENSFYLSTLNFDNIEYLFSIPSSFPLIPFNPFLDRLLRRNSSIGTFIPATKEIVVLHNHNVYCFSLETRSLRVEFTGFLGKPFNISPGPKWLPGSLLFADYVASTSMNRCNIYQRHTDGQWRVVYSFPPGTINHIHNIQLSLDANFYYVTTGDFAQAAAIWRFPIDFSSVMLLAQHGQSSRACWVFEHRDRLYYASDSQTDQNHLYSCSNQRYEQPFALFPIAGPSIRFLSASDSSCIFSTTVEPRSFDYFSLFSLFDNRLAPSLHLPFAYIYHFNVATGLRVLHKVAKDKLPMRLFQFGDIRFPNGPMPPSKVFHYYEQACKSIPSVSIMKLP